MLDISRAFDDSGRNLPEKRPPGCLRAILVVVVLIVILVVALM